MRYNRYSLIFDDQENQEFLLGYLEYQEKENEKMDDIIEEDESECGSEN